MTEGGEAGYLVLKTKSKDFFQTLDTKIQVFLILDSTSFWFLLHSRNPGQSFTEVKPDGPAYFCHSPSWSLLARTTYHRQSLFLSLFSVVYSSIKQLSVLASSFQRYLANKRGQASKHRQKFSGQKTFRQDSSGVLKSQEWIWRTNLYFCLCKADF